MRTSRNDIWRGNVNVGVNGVAVYLKETRTMLRVCKASARQRAQCRLPYLTVIIIRPVHLSLSMRQTERELSRVTR